MVSSVRMGRGLVGDGSGDRGEWGDTLSDLGWLLSRLGGWPVRSPTRRPEPDGALLAVDEAGGAGGVRVRRLRYASDGLAVTGYRLDPPGSEASAPGPAILYLRGGLGPHGRVMGPDLAFLGDLARELGIPVVASQYRGNDGGEGEDRAGEGEAMDGVRAVLAAASLGGIDPGRIGVLGFSRGATMAWMAMRRGFLPVTVMTIGGITETEAARREGTWLLAAAIHVATGGRPGARPPAYRERSPLRWVPELPRVPCFLVHGESDEVVRPWQSVELAEGLGNRGVPVRLLRLPGADHKLDSIPAERLRLATGWFREQLLATAL